jgi:uracil-DNA glycosylase family 4
VHITEIEILQRKVIACTRCPRLVGYRQKVAREKRRRFRNERYWGKPVPSFGDPRAKLLVVGLAPGAHGSNRTGRMFTGDRSGEFLYRALYEAGFANQPESCAADDGLKLRGCYITAAVRCVPPHNKPRPGELRNCQPYLERELALLRHVRAVLALGRIAFDTFLRIIAQTQSRLKRQEPGVFPPRPLFRFAHGASYQLPGGLPRLFASYHPSQQNTQTGRLTPAMFGQVLQDIRKFLAAGSPSSRR